MAHLIIVGHPNTCVNCIAEFYWGFWRTNSDAVWYMMPHLSVKYSYQRVFVWLHEKQMPSSKGRRTSNAQGYQPLRGGPETSASLFPSLGRRVSPDRDERPAERPLDRNQRIQPQPTVNKTIAPGQVDLHAFHNPVLNTAVSLCKIALLSSMPWARGCWPLSIISSRHAHIKLLSRWFCSLLLVDGPKRNLCPYQSQNWILRTVNPSSLQRYHTASLK